MFGIILPGRPCLTNLVSISATQVGTSFPAAPAFSHIVVFMLPGYVLPPDTAAAVHLQLPGEPQFKLLGVIGNEKQSAVFQVNLHGSPAGMRGTANAPATTDVQLGISVEPAASIQAQLATVRRGSMAMVRRPPSTKVLAQRIIKNAFNFLASFSGSAGGQEVVPLKSFQDWWTKFERKVENDPGFLERDDDG